MDDMRTFKNHFSLASYCVFSLSVIDINDKICCSPVFQPDQAAIAGGEGRKTRNDAFQIVLIKPLVVPLRASLP
jgi:hypothetical protein